MGAMQQHIITHNLKNVKLESTEILKINFFFLFISFDSCYKKMLLESQNIPLRYS